MKRVHKAIIPVAGWGTRLLPATKSQPKEMLPVGRKPVVQYVVEELEKAGVSQILFITGRRKQAIENHFDRDNELIQLLSGKNPSLLEALHFENAGTEFFYTRQRVQRGLADAVGCGQHFVGDDEPFIVALGDTIIYSSSQPSLLERMAEAFFSIPDLKALIAVEEVEKPELRWYGVVSPAQPPSSREPFLIDDLVEKPSPDKAPSNLAIAARYIFTPDIFEAIQSTQPDARGELQLTDSIRLLLKQGHKVAALKLEEGERRYDIGNFYTYYRAFLDFALRDTEFGSSLLEYLRSFILHKEGDAE